MKILIATLMSAFVLMATNAQAKECKSNPINFRINPFSLVADSVAGGIDVGLSSKFSLGVDAGYSYNTELFTPYKGKAYSGGLSLTYYANSMREDSFVASAGVSKSYVQLVNDSNTFTARGTTGDVKAGYRWIWANGFNTKLAAGIGQTKFSNSEQINGRGLAPVAEFSFGYQL